MDLESLIAQFSPFFRKYWLPLALFCLGLMFFIYGLIAFFGSASKSQDITFQKADSTSVSESKADNSNLILVDVEGAVVVPGVYKLTANSIIQDALVSAQGLSSDADRDWVAKNINLAAKLSDGAKVYIPRVDETTNSNTQILNNNDEASALININTASSQDLDSLPGVGPATITKIVNGRPYSDINQLLDKKVVSSKVFSEIKDKISVY